MVKKTTIFFIAALFSFQVSNAAIIASDPADNVLELLDELRQVVRESLVDAFTIYIALSDQVDSAAQEAKNKDDDNATTQCANDQATEAINLIFGAAITLTGNSLQPLTDTERELVDCRPLDEECIRGVIEDLQSIIDALPDDTTSAVEDDEKTIADQVSLIQACGSQAAKSQKVAPLGAADDAKALLNRLRQVTLDNINLAGLDYIAMSQLVYSTTQTKLASSTSDELFECVTGHADAALNLVYTADVSLIEIFLKPLYDTETQLVICGASDEECVNGIIPDLQDRIDATPGAVNNEVQMDSTSVSGHLSALRAC